MEPLADLINQLFQSARKKRPRMSTTIPNTTIDEAQTQCHLLAGVVERELEAYLDDCQQRANCGEFISLSSIIRGFADRLIHLASVTQP